MGVYELREQSPPSVRKPVTRSQTNKLVPRRYVDEKPAPQLRAHTQPTTRLAEAPKLEKIEVKKRRSKSNCVGGCPDNLVKHSGEFYVRDCSIMTSRKKCPKPPTPPSHSKIYRHAFQNPRPLCTFDFTEGCAPRPPCTFTVPLQNLTSRFFIKNLTPPFPPLPGTSLLNSPLL